MSETNVGAVATSPKTTDEGAAVPSREEALKALAGDVLKSFDEVPGKPEVADPQPEAAKPEAKAGEEPVALSQAGQGAEPKWTPEQEAWFAKMETAKTPEEIEAAKATQPEFTPEQVDWLKAQEAEGEPKADDHLNDDAELKGKLDAATQERINKRIGKEVAKTKAEKERAEQLAAENESLRQQLQARPETVTPPGQRAPLDGITDAAKLKDVAQQAEQALDLADDLLARLEDEPEAVEAVLRQSQVKLADAQGQEDFSPNAMKRYLATVKRNADRTLRRDIPARQQFLKDADAYAAEALDFVPELKDAKSERRKLFENVVASAPWLKSRPSWAREAAVYVLGLEAYQKLQQAKTAPVAPVRPKRPVPVVIPSPRGAAPVTAAPKPQGVSDDVVDAALSGDKRARLKYIQSLVAKTN